MTSELKDIGAVIVGTADGRPDEVAWVVRLTAEQVVAVRAAGWSIEQRPAWADQGTVVVRKRSAPDGKERA